MLLLALFLGLSAPAWSAPAIAASSSGYVVRVDSDVVYLDLGSGSGARAGESFRVYTLGPALIDPATGKNLGQPKSFVAEGRLTDVEALYSEGVLVSFSTSVAAGMRAELYVEPAADAVQAPPAGTSAAPAPAGRKPRWRSPWFNFPVAAFVIADFSGAGKDRIALASRKTVRLYAYPPQGAKALAEFTVPGIGSRLVSLESAPAASSGPARLLATFYDDALDRMETDVLAVSSGAWVLEQNIPWMVRTYQRPDGARALAAQQLLDDETFPFSAIYPLIDSDGRFAPGDKALKPVGSDWLYGFTQISLDSAPAELSITDTHRLEVKSAQGKWENADSFGRTPVRLRWQGKLLEFYPPMPVIDAPEGPSVFLVRNESRFGAMAEAFGIFDNAEIIRENWSDDAFAPAWTSEVPGFVTNLALVGPAEHPKDLVAAVSTRSGKSSIWIYDP
ncbi:MAG TPA: hypothetical protein VNK24_03575 [Elusimicrobiota bacterium]|nr:hypothetical protein [Elusimicrobiota bacterium]